MSPGVDNGVLQTWCIRIDGCSFPAPSGLSCEASATDVLIAWTNAAPYDAIDVYRDGALLATLAGTATSYLDPGLPTGRYRYRLTGSSVALDCIAHSFDCRAAVGFVEVCDATETAVAPGVRTPDLYTILLDDDTVIDEAEVSLDMTVETTGSWEIWVSSPFGTEVVLHEGGGDSDSFLVIWSDNGARSSDAATEYNCDYCLLEPSGPGTMADFSGEISEGAWILSFLSPEEGTLHEWCIAVSEGCGAAPPASVMCTETDGDIVLVWSNSDDYSDIEIERNDLVIATISAVAASFTDENVPGGKYTYRVFGVSPTAGCSSGSQLCTIEHLLSIWCDATDAVFDATNEQVTLEVGEAMAIRECEIAVDLANEPPTIVIGVLIRSPAETEVVLYLGTSLEGDIDAIFSEAGQAPDLETTYDCGGCRIRPQGPGTLQDFENEQSNGSWTLTIWTVGGSATLDEWCVRVYAACELTPPVDVSCENSGGEIELSWTNGAPYDEIRITRDDVEIAMLSGSETAFVDRRIAPGEIEYRVIAVSIAFDCSIRSNVCRIEFARTEHCSAASVEVPASGEPTAASLNFLAPEDAIAAAIEVYIDITTTDVGAWDRIAIVSPIGTSVQLHDNGGGFAEDFVVTYSDEGLENTGIPGAKGSGVPSIYDCAGCLWQPSGPGELADFIGEQIAGDWILELTTPIAGTLHEWCVAALQQVPDAVPPEFIRGDASGNGITNALFDALYILSFTFSAGPGFPCDAAADVNGNSLLEPLADTVYLLSFQFSGGPALPAPGHLECGPDPDGLLEPLSCEVPPSACTP